MKIYGNIIDPLNRRIIKGYIQFEGNTIEKVVPEEHSSNNYIMPGLIDSHVHIESSMIIPSSFAAKAVSRGTTGVISDPHEIANVMGRRGVDFMISNGKTVPFRFWFGAPSCVPATLFETSGATLGPEEVDEMMKIDDIVYLAEVMNFPGVISREPGIMSKIDSALKRGKKVDGHAPGVTGGNLELYVSAGISTDHECMSYEEGLEKIKLGMKVLIREGSAARNLDSLKKLIRDYPSEVMICSDDLHPETLRDRHLDKIIAKLINEGYDLFDVLRSVTVNPVNHYGIKAGLLQPGDLADFIIVDSPEKMNVKETWIGGQCVYSNGVSNIKRVTTEPFNNFNSSKISASDIKVLNQKGKIRVIEAFDGELFTHGLLFDPGIEGTISSRPAEDILKIVVKDRYNDSKPSVGFIKGLGLKHGAFASSVAHDSHNIIAAGVDDESIVAAVNRVVEMRGGLAVVNGKKTDSLMLEIGGIMTSLSCDEVAEKYEELSSLVKAMGSPLKAPFMTLSFMALLVIPELKLSDKGLFNGKSFSFVPLQESV